jgi:beta-phosphoglucomutase-like phosphatase (HAD superfamily)
VASSSSPERIRASLEVTGLVRFFEPRCFSASAVRHGKPAPDLFFLAAARSEVEPSACIVVEDSAPGIAAAVAAGMTPIGFVGGSLTPGKLAAELLATGARTIVADMRALKSAIADLRGW